MRTKVSVEELKIGMYVAELDRPWRETPFMFQGFEIRSEEELEQLKRHCNFVYVVAADPLRPHAPRAPAPGNVERATPVVITDSACAPL